tara:strand:- start:142 stop:396 length:255 start_codon:yes stop_codon:yes gene_type:complete
MKTSFPSLQEQGKNLAKFTFNVVKDSISLNPVTTNVFSSSEEQKKRLDLCMECDSYYQGRCKECGCFMKSKVKLSLAKCPIGIW